MIALLAFACLPSAESSGSGAESSDSPTGGTTPTTPDPGTAVVFDEVIWGEASGHWSSKDTEEPCVTAHVEPISSEGAWESIRTSWLLGWDVPSFDWESETVLVAYIDMCTMGKNDLEMTAVWDTGGGALQVDLTFHRGVFGTAEVVRPFSIATVPQGEYVATANVTVSHDDTGFGSRD